MGPKTLLSGIMAIFQRGNDPSTSTSTSTPTPLGKLWDGTGAAKARKAGEVASKTSTAPDGSATSVRLCVRNYSDQPLIMCWVDFHGQFHHYYILEPPSDNLTPAVDVPPTSAEGNKGGLRGTRGASSSPPPSSSACDTGVPGGVAVIDREDHVETTCLGHCFVVACAARQGRKEDGNENGEEGTTTKTDLDILRQARRDRSLRNCRIIGGYRPLMLSLESHKEEDGGKDGKEGKEEEKEDQGDDDSEAEGKRQPLPAAHVWTILRRSGSDRRAGGGGCWDCCAPASQKRRLGGPRHKRDDDEGKEGSGGDLDDGFYEDYKDEDDDDDMVWYMTVQQGRFDTTPLDTTTKPYEEGTLGGWKVRAENNWHGGDETLLDAVDEDLRFACERLPPHARESLRQDTPVWINRTLRYGPAACPVKGKGLCFHVNESWLIENGCHPEKAKCIELYDAEDYRKDRSLWGKGGVFLHELSHAYHNKVVPDGYDNEDIILCYRNAMDDGLYDCVRVHGPQGPERRAYACQDHMEYWAELSTAFLGCKDGDENPDEEYNKWYPFNRKQLKQHDPRAYELLRKLWKTDD